MVDTKTSASLWVVALWAEYPARDQWQTWADVTIAKHDALEDWLIKLSLAEDAQQAIDAVMLAVDASSIWSNGQLRDSGIGFYWMKYQSSRIDLKDCLSGAGSYADRFDTSIECECFFSLLNELESGFDVEDKAREMFEPYRRLAESNWQNLMDYADTPK
jgi:hypothetical protein